MTTTFHTSLEDIHDNLLLKASAQVDVIEPLSNVTFDIDYDYKSGHEATPIAIIRNKPLTLGEVAHENLRTITEMGAYYDKLLASDPELLVTNLQRRCVASSKPQMIRIEGDEVRAVLSNSYKRIDALVGTEELKKYAPSFPDWTLESGYIGTRATRIRYSNPALTTTVRAVGDTVKYFWEMSTSEVGEGFYRFVLGMMVLRCLNGAVGFEDIASVKFLHRGTPMFNDEALLLSERTMQLEQEFTRSAIRDAMTKAFELSIEKLAPMGAMLNAAAEREVPRSINVQSLVEVTAKKFGVRPVDDMLNRFSRNAMFSQYGLADAVTEMARDSKNLDRQIELQQIGAKIYALPENHWSQLLRAAA